MGTRNIRRQGVKTPVAQPATALASAIHAQTKREFLLGFDPAFDGRDDNVVTEVVLGNRIHFVDSPTAGQYWNTFVSVEGGQVQVVIRGLPRDFKLQNRNTFRGLTRIARKNDVRNGETIIVTIMVPAEGEGVRELTHQLKIFGTTPKNIPANKLALRTHMGMVAILELSPEEQQEAA